MDSDIKVESFSEMKEREFFAVWMSKFVLYNWHFLLILSYMIGGLYFGLQINLAAHAE